ncbi:NAD-dependent epimerase/dehydratase family protein [Aquirufa aurantiipilula]|uniref:NAD-dependent epimerase/dehydratase family protein n=1 Tax=Aquirufa aurantiipilula TaxID=2696561 RepID=UPI00293D2A6F|nr:NAD-dependent epimerase/dehydratase family protein [Aquirufa aurantiipilula]MBZ1326562.1 NAD-dependent epimerase/dehydratase family protein [Aquirufa aurantiipilula]
MKIFITGASGFVGKNVIESLAPTHEFHVFDRENFNVESDVVLHLAGKAHDLKKVSEPDEYYAVNTELSKRMFDAFLKSTASTFILMSSVKASADAVEGILTEEVLPNPQTHYGKSKLLAEEYILSHAIPDGKRVYILRPCMIHGPGNKGNLNLLFEVVRRGIPWPLGAFSNHRSFCSIDNLVFVIQELIDRKDIPSGIYQVADDESLSTNELIQLMAQSAGKQASIWNLPKAIISRMAQLGDWIHLPLNSERLTKLTESYVVSNEKITQAIGKKMPLSSREGILKTLTSFSKSSI